MNIKENMTKSNTQQKILEVAKQEFLSKSFKEASLRGIVKEAGFTQGAFYGYYQNKEELFNAIVSPVLEVFLKQFKDAQKEHYNLIKKNETHKTRELTNTWLTYFIDYVYENFDVFKLVICCSEGTRHANFLHDIVELDAQPTFQYFQKLQELGKIEGSISYDLHHIITSAYFTAIFEMVVHDMPREKAHTYVQEISIFFQNGWNGLLKFL